MGRSVTDLLGQRFGALTVRARIPTHKPHAYWLCACDCGNTTTTRGDTLRVGRAQSCGCVISDARRDAIRKIGRAHLQDLIGRQFDRLRVASRAPNRSGRIYWTCTCSCGGGVTVLSSNLTMNRTRSCGCLEQESRIKHGLSGTAGYKAAGCSKRRARKAGAGGQFTESQMFALYLAQGCRCNYCATPLLYDDIHRDHRVPIARGGSSDISNMQVLCALCNLRKGDRHPDVFERLIDWRKD